MQKCHAVGRSVWAAWQRCEWQAEKAPPDSDPEMSVHKRLSFDEQNINQQGTNRRRFANPSNRTNSRIVSSSFLQQERAFTSDDSNALDCRT